jgi:hypothetical protein
LFFKILFIFKVLYTEVETFVVNDLVFFWFLDLRCFLRQNWVIFSFANINKSPWGEYDLLFLLYLLINLSYYSITRNSPKSSSCWQGIGYSNGIGFCGSIITLSKLLSSVDFPIVISDVGVRFLLQQQALEPIAEWKKQLIF